MKICKIRDIKEGVAQAFRISEQLEIFIVRRGKQNNAYQNRCPHTGAPLNWLPDQFLDASGEYIQCTGHDAMFRIQDGLCISGPCHSQVLTAIDVVVIDGDLIYQ